MSAVMAVFVFCGGGYPGASAELGSNYRIQPNDVVEVRVFQEDDLNTVAKVNADGKIALPLVGSVTIAGKTIEQAIGVIQAAYRNGYLVNPQISILVNDYGRQFFTVLGQVARPGSYSFDGTKSISLLEAIGLAGGYTRIANPGRITIERKQGGKSVIIPVDARRSAKSKDLVTVEVKAGDIITVGESFF